MMQPQVINKLPKFLKKTYTELTYKSQYGDVWGIAKKTVYEVVYNLNYDKLNAEIGAWQDWYYSVERLKSIEISEAMRSMFD